MGSFCQSDSTVNQTQTYRPDPRATSAITGALGQAQNVAQTPFQTPQAPVAGFSPDQLQAFQGVRNAQGQAQPYLDEAQDYFSGNRVNQFLNPYAANVMAGLKDVFGQQMSQTTGNLTQQAGGVGADRIAVGQAELAKQQGLAAGQTLAGLYQPALNASQNAGFGIGSLGPVAQNAALQGSQAQLGTGGLQQQLQQAQMNAPYQQQLAQIQWPYQNAQFLAGITGSLAPGLGGTTTGNTQYPQQSPLGTVAGLGMAGLGAYGAYGGFGGGGSEMSYLPQNYQSPAYNPATNTINPNYQAARGGRINPYAEGGVAGYAEGGETDDSMDDQIQAAEIQSLRDAGKYSDVGIHAPQSGTQPINIAPQSLIPTGQIPQIQAHIPQLQAPQQQSGGGGGMLGNIASTALKLAPMLLLNRGGAVHGYAEGGAAEEPKQSSYYESFLKALRGINEAIAPTPRTGSIGHDMLAALPFASGALRPSGIRLTPTNTANPRMQIRGRFSGHSDEAMLGHPAVSKWPFIASGQLASNMYGTDDSPSIERAPEPAPRHNDADMMAGAGKGADEGNPFAERWGEMAPSSESPRQDPLFLQSGMTDAPPRPADTHVPLPRSNPFVPMALDYERKKRAAVAPPVPTPDRAPPYRSLHMAEGGEVEDEFTPFTRRQAALESSDPFERAALRTRESVRPTTGRKEGPLMGAAGTALAIAGGPEAMLANYVPRLGGALYGLAAGTAPTEAGEPDFKWNDPNQDRAKRLNDIDAAIALESGRKTPSAPGTQKARIDSLAKEKEVLLKSRGEDYNFARDAFTTEQDRLREEAAERKKAETSLFDKIPGTRAAITAASPVVSFLGGKYLGKRLSPYAAIPIGATTGAIEGGASIAGPTEMDINSLPRSSATRQEAEADLDKKSYWQRVALAAGVSGAAGALGATKGYASTRPVRAPSNVPSISTAAQQAVQAAAPRIKIPYELKDGSTVFRYPNGRFHTGKTWTKAPDISKAKVGKPIPYGSGGAVNPYASGGSTGLRKDLGYDDIDTIRNDSGYYDIGSNSGPEKLDPDVEPFGGRWNALSDPFPSELQQPPIASSTRLDPEDEEPVVSAPPAARQKPEVEFDGNSENPFAPPQKRSDLVDNPWMALMQAGLGTMAAAGHRDSHGLPTSPAAAIGQGGMKGTEALREQQTARMKQQSVEQAAKRLDAEALRHQRAMGETERHNKANEARQKEMLELQKQKATTGLFDDETATLMAQQALRGDKSVFANLGRGVAGPQNIVKVRTIMNQLAKEQGLSGNEIAALNANFGAQSAAARTAAVREANIATAVEEAKGTFPLALAASEALPRTDFVPINKLLQAWRTGTSTPEQAEFALAHQAVITAYSQAMSRTGVNTVHAQQRAEDAFSSVQNHEAYERSIKQLEREMAVALSAPEKARQMILDKISGKKTEPAAAAGSKNEGFTGRTATNPTTGKKVREKSDGSWVE